MHSRVRLNDVLGGTWAGSTATVSGGNAASACHVVVSDNLKVWQDLTVISNFTGNARFRDPAATNGPVRFYRAWLVR